MAIFKRIDKQILFEKQDIESVDYFYNKMIVILLKFTVYLVSPILLIGSYFYFKDGSLYFGILEISLVLILLIVVYINIQNFIFKKLFILTLFYLFSVFVLLTTGISGGGMTSILTSILFISLLSSNTKSTFFIITLNAFVFLIISILMSAGTLDSLHIAEYKETWPFVVVLLNLYAVGLLLVIGFYKKTVLKQVVEKMAKAAELEVTLLSVGDGIISTDKQGKITLMNDVALELTGWKKEDAFNASIEEVFDIHSIETGKKCECKVKKLIELGTAQEYDKIAVLHSKDGSKRPVANSVSPINLESGEIFGVVIAFRDYTEKYQKEEEISGLVEELQNSRVLLESSLESPKDLIIISLNKDYEYLYFNKAHRISMKLAYNSEIQIGDCIFDYMTSQDDIKRIKSNYDLALSGTTHSTLEKYGDIEADYFETNFNPILDPSKNVIGVTVFASNVTARINMENTILMNERRYRGLVDNLDTAVIVFDADASIISCNTKAAILFGISIENLKGKTPADPLFNLIDENENKLLFDKKPVNVIRDTLLPIKDKVIGISRSDGEITWILVNGIPTFDVEDKLTEIVISFNDITEARRNETALVFAAYNDYLTGIFNRRYFEEQILELDIKENYPITIVMSDINGLKLINDAFGHSVGDELLISAANLIADNCRESDLFARIGGDEFVILMPKTTEETAEGIVGNINNQAKEIMINSIPLSISFGYMTKTREGEDIQETYRRAEDFMYRRKLLSIPSMRSSAIETILKTLYEKDERSETHSRRVSELSKKLAKAYGLSKQDIDEVKTAGLLHDIGKIIISSSLINKVGKLTPEEYIIIQNHSEIGFRILNSTQDMRGISDIVLNHHERWDGNGYPRGIKSNEIPLKSRIISIADSFDAMTSERTYRDTLTKEDALKEIMDNAGKQFDPKLVIVFEKHFNDITEE